LSESAVLLLASRTEGAPLVVAEALAAGVPVIATDCSSGVREFLGANDLVYTDLIARESPRAIAEALVRFSQAETSVVPTQGEVTGSGYERWSAVFDLL
jgi:glycosyltransferase involved in cell wall biosynthesis